MLQLPFPLVEKICKIIPGKGMEVGEKGWGGGGVINSLASEENPMIL